jgi:hypothetical protein
MSAAWSPVRIAWALFGALVLVGAGAGTYFSLHREVATERAFVPQMRASPRALPELAIYVDPGMRATSQLATPGVPTTLLSDAQGRELGRHSGPAQWDDAEAVRAISRYVAR